MIENASLLPPIRFVFRTTVEANLADVAGFAQQRVEQWQFTDTLMGNLRMQAQGGPNAVMSLNESARPAPCLGCCGH